MPSLAAASLRFVINATYCCTIFIFSFLKVLVGGDAVSSHTPYTWSNFLDAHLIDMFVPFAISLVKCPCFATDKIYINICYNKCFLWYVLSIFLVRYTHLNLTLYVYICRKLHSVMSIYRRLIDPMCPCMWFVFRFEFFSSQFKLVHWQFMGMMLVT